VNVLDLGCGPGTYVLGFLEYVKRNRVLFSATSRITWRGLDRSRACLQTASSLLAAYISAGGFPADVSSGSFCHTPHSLTRALRELSAATDRYHIIIAGNVLTELPEQDLHALLSAIAACLADEAALIVIDPGTKRSFRTLHALHDAVLDEPSLQVYAPCLRQEPCPCSPQTGAWCHAALLWKPPRVVQTLDALLPFSKQRGIKYSYLTCTRPPADSSAVHAGMPRDRLWRVVSSVIRTRGEERLYLCNGAERVLVRRLLKNAAECNRQVTTAHRGDIVYLGNATQRGRFLDITRDTAFRRI